MNFKVNFSEQREGFSTRFGEVQNVGTTDHDLLTNRCIPDQHCIGSITGLEDALAEKLPARSFVFGTTDGTVYEGSAGAKNAEDIAFVKQVLIEAGTITKIEVEQAYTSRVTADGQNIVDGQKTPVALIKGSTVRCENLIPYPYKNTSSVIYFPQTVSGINFTQENGIITANGTNTQGNDSIWFMISQHIKLTVGTTYYISGCPVGGGDGKYSILLNIADASGKAVKAVYDYGNGTTYTAQEGEATAIVYIRVYPSATVNNVQFKPLFKVGTKGQWTPYFTDLKHAKIDSIVSTGRNLLDISKLVGDALVDNGDGTYTITKNGSKRFSKNWVLDNPIFLNLVCGSLEIITDTTKDGLFVSVDTTDGKNKTFGFKGNQFSANNSQIKKMTLYINHSEENGASITFKNLFLTREVANLSLPYTPFIQETYQLPETLELPEWDRFNPQTGEIVRGTKRLVLTGNEYVGVADQSANGRGYELYIDITNNPAPSDYIGTYYAISPEYKTVSREDVYIEDGSVPIIGCAGNYIRIKEPRFNHSTGDTDFKAYVKERYETGNPLIVEYKLATPTVEKLENAPKSYTAHNQGNETAVLENEEFGAIPTITNEYFKVKV